MALRFAVVVPLFVLFFLYLTSFSLVSFPFPRPSFLPTPLPSHSPTGMPTPIPTPAYCSSGYFARLDPLNPARYNCTPCASGSFSNVSWNEGAHECTDW